MVVTVSELQKEVSQVLKYGEQIRFKYYNVSSGDEDYYDDSVTLTQSGTDFWCSGLVQPIDKRNVPGGYDGLLLEQGKVVVDDKKIYILGNVQTSGLGPIKIGMTGSPPTREYEILQDGQAIHWNINGSPVYKKVYVRYLNNGSFIGE